MNYLIKHPQFTQLSVVSIDTVSDESIIKGFQQLLHLLFECNFMQ